MVSLKMKENSSVLNKGGAVGSTGKYTTRDGTWVAHKIKQYKNKIREGQLIRTNDPHVVLTTSGERKGNILLHLT